MKTKENVLELTGLSLMVFEFFIWVLYFLNGTLSGKDYYQIFLLLLLIFGLCFSLGSFKTWKLQNTAFKHDSWLLIISFILGILVSIILVLKAVFKPINYGFLIGSIILLVSGSILVLISTILKLKKVENN